jgi:hypothetical protein
MSQDYDFKTLCPTDPRSQGILLTINLLQEESKNEKCQRSVSVFMRHDAVGEHQN